MLTAIELLAVISGAIFGVLLARRKQMDSVVGTEYALQADVAPFVAVLSESSRARSAVSWGTLCATKFRVSFAHRLRCMPRAPSLVAGF